MNYKLIALVLGCGLGAGSSVVLFSSSKQKPCKTEVATVDGDQEVAEMAGCPTVVPVTEKACAFKDDEAVQVFLKQLQQDLAEGRFAELENALAEKNGMLTIGGASMVAYMGRQLQKTPQFCTHAKSWVSQSPDNAFANYFAGLAYLAEGWEARGGDWADYVDQAQWDEFDERLNQATTLFLKAWHLKPDCSLPPAALVEIAAVRGTVEDFMPLVTATRKIEPRNISVLETAFHYLRPRWEGRPEQADQLMASLIQEDQKQAPTLYVGIKYLNCVAETEQLASLPKAERLARLLTLYKQFEPQLDRMIEANPESPYAWQVFVEYAVFSADESIFQQALAKAKAKFPDAPQFDYMNYKFCKAQSYWSKKAQFEALKAGLQKNPAVPFLLIPALDLVDENPALMDQAQHRQWLTVAADLDLTPRQLQKVKVYQMMAELQDQPNSTEVLAKCEALLMELKLGDWLFENACGEISKAYLKAGNRERAVQFFRLPVLKPIAANRALTLPERLQQVAEFTFPNAKAQYEFATDFISQEVCVHFPQVLVAETVLEALKKTDGSLTQEERATFAERAARRAHREKLLGLAVEFSKMAVGWKPNYENYYELARIYESQRYASSDRKPFEPLIIETYGKCVEIVLNERRYLTDPKATSERHMMGRSALLETYWGTLEKAEAVLAALEKSEQLNDSNRYDLCYVSGRISQQRKAYPEALKLYQQSLAIAEYDNQKKKAREAIDYVQGLIKTP